MPIYERTMKITMMSDEWIDQDKNVERVQGFLADLGIYQVPSYYYGSAEDCEDSSLYGFNEHTKTTNHYEIMIDGNVAFTVEYSHQANQISEQLEANGFDWEVGDVSQTRRFMGWRDWRGNYQMHTWNSDGISSSSAYPNLRYELDDRPDVKLETTLRKDYGEWVLTFVITHEVETISDRKNIEDSIIHIPANDMKFIRESVHDALTVISNADIDFVVDCSTKILSSVNYDCSPETVKLVMD